MSDMILFFQQLLQIVADFLLAEPIRYFTGIFIGLCCIYIFGKLLRLAR